MIEHVQATTTDIPFLVSLSEEKYLGEVLLAVPTSASEAEKFWQNYLTDNFVYIAKLNGLPLGFLAYKETRDEVVLDCVLVDSKYAGEGVGSMLIRYFENKFWHAQPKLVYGWVHKSNSFLLQSLTRQGWIVLLNEAENSYGNVFKKVILK